MQGREHYELGLQHGTAITAPATRLRGVSTDALGAAAWGDNNDFSTWEELREEHKGSDPDEKDSTPYAVTCASAERVRARLLREVEAEAPEGAAARAVLVAWQELRAAFEPDGDETTAGRAAAKLCKAIGGRAGAWLACLLTGQEIREEGGTVDEMKHADLRELVADVPRPLFDSLGVAIWSFWTREGKRELLPRRSLLRELQELAERSPDADARAGAFEVAKTIADRPDRLAHVITDDSGTRILLFTRHNFEAAGVQP